MRMYPIAFPAVAAAFGQPRAVPCGTTAGGAEETARQGKAAPAVQRPGGNRTSLFCRCGLVDAAALVSAENSQEVPILVSMAGRFRFSHVLLQEAGRFASGSVARISVGVGRLGLGPDLVSPFALMSPSAPNNSTYERPGPPQLSGTYDLVLVFQASSALGDGTTSNLSAGTVSWEVCGYGGTPTAR